MDYKILGEKIMSGNYLSLSEIQNLVNSIKENTLSDTHFIHLLTAMETRNRIKGVNTEEVVDFLNALKFHSRRSIDNLICCAGVGGDPIKTINISTPSAILVSSFGLKVLKHGYKSVTGKSGSRNIIEELGINPFLNPQESLDQVERIGISYFDFKNTIIKEMRHGMKSPLHYMGALSHPFDLKYKILGTSNKGLIPTLENVLDNLVENYIITYNPNIDEISTLGETHIIERRNGVKREYTFDPNKFSFKIQSFLEIQTLESAKLNAEFIERTFKENKDSNYRDILNLNSGAILYLTGIVSSIEDGFYLSQENIQNGKAYEKLNEWKNDR